MANEKLIIQKRLIRLGFCVADRAYILEHKVQTNESNYSLTDMRRLSEMKDMLISE